MPTRGGSDDAEGDGRTGDDAREGERSFATNVVRIAAMAVLGVASGTAIAAFGDGVVGVVAGWAVGCLVYLVWVWAVVWRFDGARTQSHAQREEPARAVSDALVIIASVASLGAIGMLLLHAASDAGARAMTSAIALGSVALSWFLVHTLYMLRYAREYYRKIDGEEDDVDARDGRTPQQRGFARGIDFEGTDLPRYSDFAYLAFDLGMTFQISDTGLSSSRLRRIVLGHTLISYLFNTVVVAATVNLIINIGGSS